MGFLGALFGFGQDSSNGASAPANTGNGASAPAPASQNGSGGRHRKHGGKMRPGLARPSMAPKAWKASGLRLINGCVQSGRPGLVQPSMMPVKLSNQNDPNAPTVDLSTSSVGQTDTGSTQYGYNVSGGSSGLQGWLAGHNKKKHRHGPHHPN